MLKSDIIEIQVVQDDNFKVEYSAIPAYALVDSRSNSYSIQQQAQKGIEEIDSLLTICEQTVTELNTEIDRLTNHADGLDYTIAVSSGIIAGLIDSFFVGELDLSWGSDKVNDFVVNNAKKQKIQEKVNEAIAKAKEKGKTLDPETLQKIRERVAQEFEASTPEEEQKVLKKAIEFMEKRYKLPGDNVFQNGGLGISPSSHHLDDLAHHPSILGLLCSIIMQFTHKGVYQNAAGQTRILVAEGGLYGTDLKSKLFAGTVNWFWHLVSDVAGSSSTAGAGMGIPGPLLSLAKEIAMIPGINKTPLPQLLNKLFVDKRIDFRIELSVAHGLGKQAVPVLINEVTVRGFYFIRSIYKQYKETHNLEMIDIKKALPFNNRTISRMLTISTGTFVAVDMADAAIRSAIKSGGFAPGFAMNFVLHVNFIGIGRFAVAVVSDVRMGIERSNKRYELMRVQNQIALLGTAKVYYRQANVHALIMRSAEIQEKNWLALESNETKMIELQQQIQSAFTTLLLTYDENRKDLESIGQMRDQIEEKNPGLIQDLLDLL